MEVNDLKHWTEFNTQLEQAILLKFKNASVTDFINYKTIYLQISQYAGI